MEDDVYDKPLEPKETAKLIEEKIAQCLTDRDGLAKSFALLNETDKDAAKTLAYTLLKQWKINFESGSENLDMALTIFTNKCLTSAPFTYGKSKGVSPDNQ